MTFPNVSVGVGDLIGEQTGYIRQGDRLPSLVMQVVDEFGDTVNLTGMTAWLSTRRVESGEGGADWGVPRQTLIFDYVQGVVVYDWQKVDTDTSIPGIYELLVELRDAATDDHIFVAPTRRDTFLAIRSKVEYVPVSP